MNFMKLQRIYVYAKEHLESSKDFYAKRNQKNYNKIFFDIFLGKLGEFFVYEFFKNKNKNLTAPPDLKIYQKKSFSPDLEILSGSEKIKLQVKTISWESQKFNGKSFLVEKSDPIIKTKDPNYFFVVVLQNKNLDFQDPLLLQCIKVKYQAPRKNLPTKLAVYID